MKSIFFDNINKIVNVLFFLMCSQLASYTVCLANLNIPEV